VGDGWSIAWRLHDAQFWGVPQRRKRICLLADFNGDTAPRILFELQRKTAESDTIKTVLGFGNESKSEIQPIRESVSRDFKQSVEERESPSSDVEGCIDSSSYTLKIRGA
jgi:site-specific DNA-cytosine methylase